MILTLFGDFIDCGGHQLVHHIAPLLVPDCDRLSITALTVPLVSLLGYNKGHNSGTGDNHGRLLFFR